MAEEDVRIRVPREDGLLLKALAYARGMCAPEFLASLIRREAAQNGIDTQAASQIVKRDAPEIAVNLRQTRIRRGLSQEAWGKLFGLTQPNVALIESGQRQIPQRILNAVLSWLTDKPSQTPPLSDPPQLREE